MFLLSGCLSRMITRPTVAIQSVQVTGLNPAGATLTFLVDLENPNGFGVTVKAFSYSVYLSDHLLAQGEMREPVSIKGRSVASIPLPLKTDLQEIVTGLKSLNSSDMADYRIEGSLKIRSFFGRLEFPYNRTGTIYLRPLRFLRPPSGGA
ncbi:MAG: LEA type 2 family protein [Nitrospirae bacterium]|nr:LEA type 2 family protein [Nitrospirota bacterium]